MPKIYSNPNVVERLWNNALYGATTDNLISKGFKSEDVNLFFEEWTWKLEHIQRKQERIKATLQKKIEDEEKSFAIKYTKSNGGYLFSCPRCKQKVKRHKLRRHLDEIHPLPSPPPTDNKSRAYQKWYHDYILQQARFNFMRKFLLSTPMRD